MTADPKPFYGRSTPRGLAALALDWAWIAGVVALAELVDEPWLYPLWFALISVKQFALGESLLHEASHHTLFAHRRLNDLVGPAVAWPFLYTMSGYRQEHRAHHRLLGDPSDPLSEQYVTYGLRSEGEAIDDPPLGWARATWIFAIRPLLGLPFLYFLRDNLGGLWRREGVGVVLSWAVIVGACATLGWLDELAMYWLVPLWFGFGALYYWSEVTDHYHVVRGDTRSVVSPIGNWLNHNNGLHALHHRYPGIPWFRLPAAYASLRGSFPEQVSHGWFDTLRQLAGASEAKNQQA